ncbi:MAG TPA: glycosyl transferase family 1, partial [Candidatus Eisenbacteria bacterium]|nr:glycosyl transferase family 1 [Candidatus Eisenbacteria bacterium]
MPKISRRHLDVLSDGIGIMQHAIGSRPDPAHGYCTDDVARALQVDLLHARTLGSPAVAGSVRRNVEFLGAAFDRSTGRFRNFRRNDGSWVDEPG